MTFAALAVDTALLEDVSADLAHAWSDCCAGVWHRRDITRIEGLCSRLREVESSLRRTVVGMERLVYEAHRVLEVTA